MTTPVDARLPSTRSAEGNALAPIVVVALVLAAFGPYIVGSIRTEQVAVYAMLVLLGPCLVQFRPKGASGFLIPWLLYISVATLGVIVPSSLVAPHAPGNALAGLDNVLLPVAVMLLIWSLVRPEQAKPLLTMAGKLVASLMAANAVLAIINTRVDLSPILRPFWTTSDSAISTAENAAGMGRLSGIFNQPAEAGTMYGVAGILAILVWSRHPKKLVLVLSLIILGGLLTVSKIFVLGALPFIIFYWIRSRETGGKAIGVLVVATAAALGIVQSGLLSEWEGYTYLARLIDPQGGFLYFYTAGRVGDDSAMLDTVAKVLQLSPFTGVGLGGWSIPYDSALTETLIMAGLLGLACYAAVLLAMFRLAWKLTDELRPFAILFAIIVTGASAGFTPLTANRTSTIMWVLVALLVVAARDKNPLWRPGSIRATSKTARSQA